VLNYDGSVYTSVVTKFNGRDQAEWVKQFAGASPSDALSSDSCPTQPTGEMQACQIATSEYDGHGRLQKSHAPQQEDKFTSYSYFADDRLHTVTDARDATTTYSYNNRALVESVTRSMPTTQPAIPFSPCDAKTQNCAIEESATASSSPIGYLDYADSTSRIVGGWSADRDSPNTSNTVQIYLDGPNTGTGAGTLIGETVADKPRADVNTVAGIPGNHGYEFEIPEQYADGKPHIIYVYGLDVAGGNQPGIMLNSPKSFMLAPPTETVSFEYDDLGNRKKMMDKTGVTTYEYDRFSRIKKENKHLRDSWDIARHDFDIQYSYNLIGQLKSITDPFGDKIDYQTDKIGKLKKITGTPFSSATGPNGTLVSVTDYVDNIEYRAWGDVKTIDYGNSINMSQTFNSRLRVDEFRVWKDGQTNSIIKKNYQYYNDNQLYGRYVFAHRFAPFRPFIRL